MTYLVDSHCHLASLITEGKGSKNVNEAILRAQACGLSHMLSISCTIDEYRQMHKVVSPYQNVYEACGIHPLNVQDQGQWEDEELISCLKSSDKIVALGETGLDYHYAYETRDLQLKNFERQIYIAASLKLPLIIHAREAKLDTLALMKDTNARDIGGVMHCFCDDLEMARKCLDMGFYISLSGISTFKAAENVREVAKYIPLDRMLVETDSPYLAPVPVRGVANEPCFVRYTLGFLSEFLNLSEEQIANETSKNFATLFQVDLDKDAKIYEKDPNLNLYKIEKIAYKSFS